jgi:hypothetical protein
VRKAVILPSGRLRLCAERNDPNCGESFVMLEYFAGSTLANVCMDQLLGIYARLSAREVAVVGLEVVFT